MEEKRGCVFHVELNERNRTGFELKGLIKSDLKSEWKKATISKDEERASGGMLLSLIDCVFSLFPWL